MAPTKWQKRVDSADWDAITAEVNDFGGAVLPRLLTTSEAVTIRGHYSDDRLFRATIDMGRYRFGEGQYRYFPAAVSRADPTAQGGLVSAAVADRGDLVFPLQVVINLSEPGVDHTGGEFLLVEQRPRAQSRGTATLLPFGHGFVFTTRERPVRSTRGWSAAPVRHGVSAIRSGERFTLYTSRADTDTTQMRYATSEGDGAMYWADRGVGYVLKPAG